jgi:UDP-N-acetylmuramoyl-tripeptide--D-alanyl-D-alanine ligase
VAAVEAGMAATAATAAEDKDEALVVLRTELRPGDVVLVKASRGLTLDTVAEALLTPDADLDRPEHPPTARKDPA